MKKFILNYITIKQEIFKRRSLSRRLFLFLLIVTIGCQYSFYPASAFSDAAPSNEVPYRRCWFFPGAHLTKFNVASDNANHVYIPESSGVLISLNVLDGSVNWKTELRGEIISEPRLTSRENSSLGENIYIITRYSPEEIIEPKSDKNNKDGNRDVDKESYSIVYSLSRKTGLVNWQRKFKPFDVGYLEIDDDQMTVFGDNGSAAVLAQKDGTTVWSEILLPTGIYLTAEPLLFDKRIYYGASDMKIRVTDALTGEPSGEFKTETKPSALEVFDGKLIYGAGNGEIRLVRLSDGKKIWKMRNGAAITNFLLTPNGILATSLDNFVYLVSRDTGGVVWKKRLGGRIEFAPVLINNKFLVISSGDAAAPLIDSAGGKTINQITLAPEDFFTGSPLIVGDQIVVPTRGGISAFSTDVCRPS